MRRIEGDITVGDIGVNIIATADESLAGKNVNFKLTKPSGQVIVRAATATSGYTATYTTASGDIDEAGVWYIDLENVTTGFHYTKGSGTTMNVRPKPEDMAAYQ